MNGKACWKVYDRVSVLTGGGVDSCGFGMTSLEPGIGGGTSCERRDATEVEEAVDEACRS
jgi:hypothetical protein